ncbi:GIY-YIG nuclease family protein [Mycolicibacterium setense]
MWLRWPARWLAVVCAVALTVGGLHLITPTPEPRADQAAPTGSAARGFAEAAVSAFTESAVGSDPTLSVEARRAGLPDDPVAGLTAQTAAGPVQVVLPGGLGAAEHTAGGQVVYPNAGAGFDMLAENTATGTRTVARISDPAGPRMVTTFVRTPADTVMLAHTHGYLTINKATPTAETVGMFSPAETRDATGKLVPSSYVVKQLAPQLYVLAEVIDPRPDTAWPVYVDPPLHLAGAGGAPLPQGFLDSFTNTVSSLANGVASAASTAASATVSGAKAVGGFVKENPLESALLVGGVALAVTGVGGPAGAAMIASATVNISSAAVDIAAAALPDNQALGIASNVLGVASMVTPQGAAKKVVKEGAELAAEQLAKHTDELAAAADKVIDTAKATPTPPAQLADEIAAAGTAKPPVTPGVSPKAPNAPPAAKAAEIPEGGVVYRIDRADGTPKYVGQTINPPKRIRTHIRSGKFDPDSGDTIHFPHQTNDRDALNGLEQREMDRAGTRRPSVAADNPGYNGVGLNKSRVYDPRKRPEAAARYEAAADRHIAGQQNPVSRPSSPAEQRLNEQAQVQSHTEQQRSAARDSAKDSGQSARGGEHGGSSKSESRAQKKPKQKKPKKKQSSSHKRRKGQK